MDRDFEEVVTSDLSLVFWPGRGGRLMSVRAHGTEFLWRNPELIDANWEFVHPPEDWAEPDGSMGSWVNVGGSKTWPAPQGWSGPGEWPGPPDDRLDSGRWTFERSTTDHGEVQVRLQSPDDDRTGLRVTREFWVPPHGTSFRQENTFTNISDSLNLWSIWEVCQTDTEGLASGTLRVGSAKGTMPSILLEVVGTPTRATWNGTDLAMPVEDVVAKLGFTDAERHVSLDRRDGRSLTLAFDPVVGAQYPDGGSRVELWMQYPIPAPLREFGGLHPQARLVELEVLGPLVEIEPAGASTLGIDWVVSEGAPAETGHTIRPPRP